MKHPSRSSNSQLSELFNQRLHMYSVAAGATGVGLLALAQPASGEIVYTPADVTISARVLHSYPLDLNGDGTIDVLLNASSRQSIDQSGGTSRIVAEPVPGNGVAGYGGHALALKAGQPIGFGRKFSGFLMATLVTFIGTEFQFHGQWANVVNRYLGLKFQVDGQTHYGWARLSVGGKTLQAKLTGYAYETIPNAPIVAGKTSGTDAAALAPSGVPAVQTDAPPATLGALAWGAPALAVWRRREMTEEAED
jgi:hypothetical protein